jgi:hypothetical protein
MYKRPQHRQVALVLAAMNAKFLREAKCYFAGGTAIILLLGEYRESLDVDFMCADREGYRMLRESVFDHGLAELFSAKIEALRDVRADRDGIRTVLDVAGTPIKFEIVREARIELAGGDRPEFPVPCLTRADLFAEKLLANADRYADKGVMSRDVIDLMVMESNWGQIPLQAWKKAEDAYGESVHLALRKAKELLRADRQYFDGCLAKMGVDDAVREQLRRALVTGAGETPQKSPRK